MILSSKNLRLNVLPSFGCRWASLQVKRDRKWIDVLVPSPMAAARRHPFLNGCFLLIPWSNRIRDARLTLNSGRYDLRSNFPDGSAIHGDVYARSWKVTRSSATYLRAGFDSRAVSDFNFPFPIRADCVIRLRDSSLRVGLSIQNLSTEKIPIGAGIHPFFRKSLDGTADSARISLPAAAIYPTHVGLPTGPAKKLSAPLVDVSLATKTLDDCFRVNPAHPSQIFYPSSGLTVKIRSDKSFGHLVAYAPKKHLGKSANFVCIEPVTHVTDGFNLEAKGWDKTGVIWLAPRKTWRGEIEISFEWRDAAGLRGTRRGK